MSKGTFFTGQPIFNQVLNFIPRSLVNEVAREFGGDHYYKSFKTYEHLVTMLYAIFNQCTCLREVTTGLLAWEQRINHLGMTAHPRRSTISDANRKRSPEIFEQIYVRLFARYMALLPDSRSDLKKNLYIIDSTTISLFQSILKAAGRNRHDGQHKGGIKVHTLLSAHADAPTMIRYSGSAANDVRFLREVRLPPGSVLVFDKGYHSYQTYNQLSEDEITWVTRHRDRDVDKVQEYRQVPEDERLQGVESDHFVELGHQHNNKAITVQARIVSYRDPITKKHFRFLTNNRELPALIIAQYYQQRWQIETFFKRIKQNYPLQYFLGDNENAIKIQIWCALIADLLLKVIKRGTRSCMAFSNIVGLIRLHLMTYMDLKSFLRSPEKALIKQIRERCTSHVNPTLFSP